MDICVICKNKTVKNVLINKKILNCTNCVQNEKICDIIYLSGKNMHELWKR